MLVTFLARLPREVRARSGERERERERRRKRRWNGQSCRWRGRYRARRAVSVLSEEADVASGNDVDGRLSLSSANNIQHRPVYTHPITSAKLSPRARNNRETVCGARPRLACFTAPTRIRRAPSTRGDASPRLFAFDACDHWSNPLASLTRSSFTTDGQANGREYFRSG